MATNPFFPHGLYTRAQIAEALGRSEKTVREWEAGGLPVIKQGGLRLYDVAAVAAWLKGRSESAKEASAA